MHQDDKAPTHDLGPPAQINIAVDILAGDRQKQIQGSPPLAVPHYGPEALSIFLRGSKITHDLRTVIENYYNGKSMRCYIIPKLRWTGAIFNLVDWDSIEAAMNAHSALKLTNVTKYMYRWQNCRAQTYQFDIAGELSPINFKKYMCPLCGTELETPDHVLQCHNKRAVTCSSTARFFLGKRLQKLKTPNRLIAAIKYGLRMYSTSAITPRQPLRYPRDFNTRLNDQIDLAFDAQSQIGWDNFCRGFVSKEWQKCMSSHYDQHHRGDITLAGDRWAAKFVQEIHEYGLSVWNHRNSIIHGESDSNFMTKDELRIQIKRCFDLRAFLGEEYSALFSTSKSARLQQKTQTVRLWIATIDAVHKEKSKRLRMEARMLP